MSEEMQQSTKSFNVSRRTKAKFLFLGAIIGIIAFIAFIFAADAVLNESYDDVTIEEFGPHDDGGDDFESVDYPAWMNKFVNPPSGVEARNVYTFSCELVLRKPDSFTTACADFGEAVWEIKWSMWSAEEARGTGIYSVNDCDPVCAEGTRHEVPVYIWLSDTSTDGKNYFLNTLRIVSKDVYEGKVDIVKSEYARLFNDVVIDGKTFTGAEWDVSDDWKSFPDLRSDLPK